MLAFALTHCPNKAISEPENPSILPITTNGLHVAMDPAILATALAITLIYRRRRRRRRRRQVRDWRPSYEYLHSSFSLELMPPGRARVWLRFTIPEIQQLAPLLRLDLVDYRNRLTVDSTTALCVICARMSYLGRWY